MQISEVEVSFGKKVPTGRFATDSVGISMTLELRASTKEEITKDIAEAYSALREFVGTQIWLSKQQMESR